jgi:hypothetical protein
MESVNMVPDMLKKLVMNPEIIAAVNKNFKSVANGSPSVSGFSELIQCVLPKNISQQNPEFLESMERFLQNPEVVACLESWQNDPGFSGPSASDITHCWKLAEAHCTSSMAQKIDVAESGQGASCVVIFFPYLDFYRVPGFQLILSYPVLTYRRHLLRCSFQHV